jgi:hypothetical protein
VKFAVPLAVGEPLMAPVDAVRDSPAGSVPELSDHVFGVVPPVDARVAEYVAPTVVSASVAVLTVSAAYMVTDWDDVAVFDSESAIRTVNVDEPAVVGVPLIAPVLVSRDSPAGSDPLDTDQVNGAVPPALVRLELYASPTTPVLSVPLRAKAGTKVNVRSAVVDWLSARRTTTDVPVPVGVPVYAVHNFPLLQLPYLAHEIPVGGVPETTDTVSPEL